MKISKINREVKVLKSMNDDSHIGFEHFLRRAMKFIKALEEQYSEENMGFISGLYPALDNTYFTNENVEEKQAQITRDDVMIYAKGRANDVAHNYTVSPVKFVNAIHDQGHVDQWPLSIDIINNPTNDYIKVIELMTVDNEYDKHYVMNQICEEIGELKQSDFDTEGMQSIYMNS